jgi:hypothetical protein
MHLQEVRIKITLVFESICKQCGKKYEPSKFTVNKQIFCSTKCRKRFGIRNYKRRQYKQHTILQVKEEPPKKLEEELHKKIEPGTPKNQFKFSKGQLRYIAWIKECEKTKP